MAIDLNSARSTDEFLDLIQLWNLEIFWPAHAPAERLLAMTALQEVLRARRVVASVQTGTDVALGLHASLVLPIVHDRVVLHDEAGTLGGGIDPDDLLVALAQHAGAWVMEPDDDGLGLVAGDQDALDAAIAGLIERVGGDVDPFAPPTPRGIFYGEDDTSSFAISAKHGGLEATLHRDVAVLGGDLDALAGVIAIPSHPGARLLLVGHETWINLSYFSAQQMALKVKASEMREPTLSVNLGLSALPVPSPDTAAGAGETPAARLAAALGAAAFTVVPEDARVLDGAMSEVRAQQAVASLSACVPGSQIARVPLAQAPWLQEAADAVEMLGFDPAWVRVLAGAEPEPEGGQRVKPQGILAASATQFKQELAKEVAAERERRAAPANDGAPARAAGGTGAGGGAAVPATQRGLTPTTRYTIGIVELLLAALLLFLQPLPESFGWANPVLAAVFTLDGVRQVWLGTRQEARAKAGRDDRTERGSEPDSGLGSGSGSAPGGAPGEPGGDA